MKFNSENEIYEFLPSALRKLFFEEIIFLKAFSQSSNASNNVLFPILFSPIITLKFGLQSNFISLNDLKFEIFICSICTFIKFNVIVKVLPLINCNDSSKQQTVVEIK